MATDWYANDWNSIENWTSFIHFFFRQRRNSSALCLSNIKWVEQKRIGWHAASACHISVHFDRDFSSATFGGWEKISEAPQNGKHVSDTRNVSGFFVKDRPTLLVVMATTLRQFRPYFMTYTLYKHFVDEKKSQPQKRRVHRICKWAAVTMATVNGDVRRSPR